MRARDLKKLKPGNKLRVNLAKNIIELLDLDFWQGRNVYLHSNTPPQDSWTAYKTRSSKKITGSTRYENFYPKELSLVKE